MKHLCLYLVSISIFLGCDNAKKDKERTDSISTVSMNSEDFNASTDSVQIISLPAPMQIPSVLKNTTTVYDKGILFPSNLTDKSFFKSTILFGMYMVDLAYVGVFNDQQSAHLYFRNCKRIGDNLGLGYEFDNRFQDRFKANVSRPDSIGDLIMQMYGVGHQYFRNNDKEGIGLLMIMGCYFEGLHLAMEGAKDKDLVLYLHLLNLHQVYAENLLMALEHFEIPVEIKPEYNMLVEVYEILIQVNAPTAFDVKSGRATINQVDLEALEQVQKVTQNFRQSMEV